MSKNVPNLTIFCVKNGIFPPDKKENSIKVYLIPTSWLGIPHV